MVTVLQFGVMTSFVAISCEGRTGYDPELARPFAIQGWATGTLRGDTTPVVTHMADVNPTTASNGAVAISITWREGGFALNPPQHDQVDTAAIPALVSQVT